MPLFDLTKKTEQDRYKRWVVKSVKNQDLVECKTKKGTLSQNSYFHLICSYFALQYGETMEYVKVEFVKKLICKEIFETTYYNRETGEGRPALKSWSKLSKEDRSTVISKFIDWAQKEADIRLPKPDDLLYQRECRVEVDRNRKYI